MYVNINKFGRMIDAVNAIMESREEGLDSRSFDIRLKEAKRDVYIMCNQEIDNNESSCLPHEIRIIIGIVGNTCGNC